MNLNDMTWHEVSKYLEKNKGIIIPVGTCEQHGYHLPLNNDILSVEFLSSKLSDITGLVVAPTINYGVNLPCDKYLSGTTSISYDTLRNIVISITDWWRFQGFNRFIFITFHGDPFHIKAMSNLSTDIILIEPYEIEYGDILEMQSTMRHACEAETSVALYLYPEKVKLEFVKEYDIPYEGFKDYLFHEIINKPDNYVGCLGYPSYATQEKGKVIVERMIEKMILDYNKFMDSF